eukprot:CAMPEP_0182417616 /NCGR_PEP_ID=MMETSP1167-20130531/2075_1 /TAXON_ID=2988 /ORGANISM="Mallomonas Sp, Strain CCMP3275" /LENGTH=194 /DNA_ID=CAMNT_0024591307 /DNA_START=104 /DNA_END=685 /DNA_ORIENTATION=+
MTRGPKFTSRTFAEKSVIDTVGESANIFVKRIQAGDTFKQSVADALAGSDLSVETTKEKIMEMVNSAPFVIFTWTMSPSCKKALKLLSEIDCQVKVIELDKPWSEGNPIRATLGRMTGRTSVPSIWLKGQFLGGYEDGNSDAAPGLLSLAFSGKLRPMLIEAGVLKPVSGIDKEQDSTPKITVQPTVDLSNKTD